MKTALSARFPLLGALVLALTALTAAAQDRTGTVEISPFGGVNIGGTLYAGSNAIFSHDVDTQSAGTFGLRVGGNVNRWFGLEANYSQATANLEGRGGTGLFGRGSKVGEMKFQNYGLDFVFNFGKRRVIPYMTVGLGATTFTARVPDVPEETDTRFTSSLGLGVKIFFNPHVALRFDGKARATYINNARCNRDYTLYCSDDNYYDSDRTRWYTSGEATGGLTFAF